MCQKCLDFAVSLFGEMSHDQIDKLFWNATSFPAGTHEQIREQLQSHYDNGARTSEEAVNIAAQLLHEEMQWVKEIQEAIALGQEYLKACNLKLEHNRVIPYDGSIEIMDGGDTIPYDGSIEIMDGGDTIPYDGSIEIMDGGDTIPYDGDGRLFLFGEWIRSPSKPIETMVAEGYIPLGSPDDLDCPWIPLSQVKRELK